ncbi:hypothetical protein PybrP1_012934 [[Pythium] brassicae (nom. inval.)]|nr:hypothetical protein PybrP1_012934 [[Pythium] brassicae (nom. inval.)]
MAKSAQVISKAIAAAHFDTFTMSNILICAFFYAPVSESRFKCNQCWSARVQAPWSGYFNLIGHLATAHASRVREQRADSTEGVRIRGSGHEQPLRLGAMDHRAQSPSVRSREQFHSNVGDDEANNDRNTQGRHVTSVEESRRTGGERDPNKPRSCVRRLEFRPLPLSGRRGNRKRGRQAR